MGKAVRHEGIPFDLTPVPMTERHDCYDCGKPVTHKAWSPYWCPQHDKERINRISGQIEDLARKIGAR